MDVLDTAVSELQEGSASIPDLETNDKTLAGAINEIKQTVSDVETNAQQQLKNHEADYVKHPAYADATFNGTNLYTVNLNPTITEYTKGLGIVFGVTTTTALNVQLRVGTLPAKDVLKSNGQVLRGTTANAVYAVRYNPLAANGNGAFILLGERVGTHNLKTCEKTRHLPMITASKWGRSLHMVLARKYRLTSYRQVLHLTFLVIYRWYGTTAMY